MRIEQEIKQRKFTSDYQRAIINIMYTSNWFNENFKGVMSRFDITSQQYNVLRILKGRYPDKCASHEIKEVMLDKSPDLTRLMDRLIEKGFVKREVCEENRRKMDIVITKKGMNLVDSVSPSLKEFENKFKKKISSKEAVELSKILDKMRG
ncbi:MAG: MarR family transcriptional regulator [Bacteroidetes bacterium]|nr:MarR family transcriptional regulator [Bacteroidota bacterium]